jgi:putative DNA methylase
MGRFLDQLQPERFASESRVTLTRDHPIISPKKLIEVALPLDAINVASAREKSIRHGHPSTLHLWWARRPLAAARAVIFSQLVNDPEDLWRCQNPGKDANSQIKGHWTKARAKLFGIIEHFVKWENITDDVMLEKAREEIRKSWRETCDLNRNHPQAKELFDPDKMPGLHDPFSGGGTIPLEAQRLGLEAFASDLNPVAVLINKAMIEIPPKFANRPPVHPEARNVKMLIARDWKGAQGLAEDVSRYGNWIRDEALKRIGCLYPSIEVTKEMVRERADLKPHLGEKLTVIAWLWTRTVKSPNPAFSTIDVPLASSFILSSKAGKEAYVDTIIDKSNYRFTVKVGKPPSTAKTGTKSARGANFRCLLSQTAIEPAYIKAESVAGRMGAKLMAIVAEGASGRIWLSPNAEHEAIAQSARPMDAATAIHVPLANDPRNLWCLGYGLDHFDKLFTPRQLVALTTFSDLVIEVRARITKDAVAAGFANDNVALESGGAGAAAYADGIAVYLGLGIGRSANYWSSLTPWGGDFIVQTFGRQAIPMVWDYAEGNVFSSSTGNWTGALDWIQRVIVNAVPAFRNGVAMQADAQSQTITRNNFVSTDPPYYDNIAYADLSDYFYVWLRRSLRPVLPQLFGTIAVPKAEELVATPYRHGSKENAESFFLNGMTQAMRRLAEQAHPGYPVTIYYAFKQSESETDTGTASTGWETFLEAVISAGFAVVGTWPMRTERDQGLKTGTNVLASSIVLVCRPRAIIAETISRRQFVRELNAALPIALDAMTRESEGLHSPVAPVDLSQAIIGPGMAVYSKYTAILEADGTPMSVRTAMQLINRFLAEDDFDADTQFCLHWFEQYGWESGKFGEADTLARAKGTSVDGVKQSGVIHSSGGNVQLLKWVEYPSDWDPKSDQRLPIWEVLHQLIRVFNTDGETGAAAVFAAVQSKAEAARQLAYRLYTLCERKNWAEDARAYNEVVTSWSGIESAAAKEPTATQRTLFDN